MKYLSRLVAAGMFASVFFSASVQAADEAVTDAELVSLIELASGLYPDYFGGTSEAGEAGGYLYRFFAESGIYVGTKDGAIYLMGGAFGSTPQAKGSLAQVQQSLQTLKNSVTVTPTADILSLFDLAEQLKPELFAGGGTLTTSADGYLYKFYTDTGIYAAVKDGTVHLKGGSFGTFYTSVGALNAVLDQLQGSGAGGGDEIPEGDFTLTVTGTVSVFGVSSPFTFVVENIPAPDTADQEQIEDAFLSALEDAEGITIVDFDYTVIESTADHVEFSMSATTSVTTSGVTVTSTYTLNYDYTK